MAKHGGIAVDDSIDQVMKATGYSRSTVSDVHRFLEWCGLEVRLKQGGGPKKQPTVRRLITEIPSEDLNGKIPNLNEYYRDLHEKKLNLNGVFPDTPRELPRFIPRVCTSKISKFIFEEPFLEENYIEDENNDEFATPLRRAHQMYEYDLKPKEDEFRIELDYPTTSHQIIYDWNKTV
jgi:hypothetical protein